MNDEGTAPPRQSAVPWDGRPERVDVLLLAAISFSGFYALVMLAFVPSLVGTHPVLLELLRGSLTAMVTMGGRVRVGDESIVVAVLAALPGLMLFDWVYWWAGRRWGKRVIDLFLGNHPKAAKRTAQLERMTARFGWIALVIVYFQPVPNPLIYAAAGWTRMRFWVFMLLDLIGSLLWIGLCVGLGYAIGEPAVRVAKQISHYGLYLTIALVVVIVARQAWTANRQASPGQG